MRQVPPDRGRVTDKEAAKPCAKTGNRKFAPQRKQNPQRRDRNQKKFHSPKAESAEQTKEENIANARRVLFFDSQEKHHQRRNQEKVEGVSARLEMPF